MTLRRFAVLFLYLSTIIITISGCKKKQSVDNKPKVAPPVLVDVMIAQREAITDVIEANGTVVANEFVEVRPEVSGRLVYINIPEGNFIPQGTVLAKLNSADLVAQIAKTKVLLTLAEKTAQRYKKLLDISGINESDYDAAVSQVNGYKADINYTQTLIDKTVIRAPFNGVVGLRQVSVGAYLTPSTSLATLQQTNLSKVDFTLPQNYSSSIKKGMAIEVEIDADSHQKTTGKIVAFEPGINTETRNLKVRALLAQTNLNAGAFVKIFINTGANQTAIIVPTNCIIPDDKNNQVIVVKNGIANFTNVQTGIRKANTVAITSGLEVGDSVVVTGVLFARPKSKVKVRSVKKIDTQDSTSKETMKN